jgi:hypothetical protein
LKNLRVQGELTEIAKAIRQIENSNYKITITPGFLSGNFDPIDWVAQSDGSGTGGSVNYNPFSRKTYESENSKFSPNGKAVKSNGIDMLAHEIAHARDAVLGSSKEYPLNEYEAVRIQNQVRAVYGLNPRPRYSTLPVPEYDKYIPSP